MSEEENFEQTTSQNFFGSEQIFEGYPSEEYDDDDWDEDDEDEEEWEEESDNESERKVLTKEIAQNFLNDEYTKIETSTFSSIEDDAAEILSKYGQHLNLSGLTELSQSAAESLSKHEGLYLYLSGLKKISDGAAEMLSKHRGGCLELNGLTEISETAALSFARNSKPENELYLNGVESFSNETFYNLLTYVGSLEPSEKIIEKMQQLEPKDWEAIQVKQMEIVIKIPGSLNLDNFAFIGDQAAEVLSGHVGDVSLNGLEEISDSVAKYLSRKEGDLELNGLSSLSDNAAKSLAKMDPDKLSLTDELEEQVAKYR